MLDGCGFTKRFFKIIFPLTKPGMIASAILAFVGAWNEFLFACILSVNKSKTLPVVIAGFIIRPLGMEWGPMGGDSSHYTGTGTDSCMGTAETLCSGTGNGSS